MFTKAFVLVMLLYPPDGLGTPTRVTVAQVVDLTTCRQAGVGVVQGLRQANPDLIVQFACEVSEVA